MNNKNKTDKQAKATMSTENATLEAIYKVFRGAITCATDEELAITCLALAEELTGSEFGFIYEVNKAGRFDTLAISNMGWQACKIPDSKKRHLLKDLEIMGLRGKVVKDKKAYIFNDPVSNPDWAGIPEGHPPVTCFLGVPLIRSGEVIGMIGLANKESGFGPTDQKAAELLSIAIVEALMRKRMEETIEMAEQNFRNSLDNSPLGICIVSAEGELLYANNTILDIYGYESIEELQATPLRERDTRVPSPYEISIVRRDGQVRHLLAFRKAVVWNDEIQFQTLYQDITESKKMQEQLIMQDRLASIGQLVSGVAHELNNPLSSIIGFTELLSMRKDLPEDAKEDLKLINSESQRAIEIVRNLLIFARKQPTEKKPVAINSVIEKVLELSAHEQRVSNIKVITDFTSDLPEVLAAASQLQQVFINIIINAEQAMFTANGRGTLTITTEQSGDIVRISFTDDGPGIAPEHLGQLFDPFFTTKEAGKGTGLGLSICYGIVTDHGGKIYAESELGRGATFVIELPVSS